MYEQNDAKEALAHVASVFPNFEKEKFYIELDIYLLEFLRNHNDFNNIRKDEGQENQYILSYIYEQTGLSHYFRYDDVENLGILMVLENVVHDLLINIFTYCYQVRNIEFMEVEHIKTKISLYINELEKRIN